ncbi:MAG: AAA family ATPase [Parvularcula sp.]|jgi:Cdc6-like AAA superfamily ATPase|nr:AAA family ATPase [Parvularcula sp.]
MAKKPKSVEDWYALEFEIGQLFDGAPIDEEDLFAGRATEVTRILRAVFEKSKHVVLFGERGVGKTSLSNIFWKRFNKGLQSFIVARVQGGPKHTFASIWKNGLEELHAVAVSQGRGDLIRVDSVLDDYTPSTVRRELQKCNANAIPVIIVDEYDKLKDREAKELTANLIKELYDYAVPVTIILVGVADSIAELVEDHQSVGRAVVQVPLNRMNEIELREIIEKRVSRTSMSFSADAKWTIITLSRGLPYFTQILSKFSAQAAIDRKSLTVSNADVEVAMKKFIEDSEVSFRDEYREATRSNQANFFQQSLLACALAKTDEEGFFTANDVVQPYSSIMKEKKRIAHFEKHLRRFASDEGGNILIKRGGDRQLIFRFEDPMMQPYVIIRGIQSGMIDDDARTTLLQIEQRTLDLGS